VDAVRELSMHAARAGLSVLPPDSPARPDFVIAVGGDGTMLSAVHRHPGVPLLGLNLGSLGFLAGVEEPSFAAALDDLAAGRFKIAERTALKSKVVRASGGEIPLPDALNDVVVSRSAAGHAACLELRADGVKVSSFLADGLIVATPTGSTAYSLAAGGPILMPDSAAFAVTPACPHALASRPLVLPDSAVLSVSPAPKGPDAPVPPLSASADGTDPVPVEPEDKVEISKSGVRIPLVELEGYNAYEVLSRKLGWAGGFRRSVPDGRN